MTYTHLRRSVAAAIVALTALLIGPLGHAQSLGDLAKKEEERRKALPPPTKVYTNKDLTPAPPGTPAPPPLDAKDAAVKDAKDGTAADAAKGGDAKDAGAKDQTYWSEKIKTLRDQLERDKTFADALQTKINALTTDFVNRDDPAQKRMIEADRQKALAELARLNKAVIDDQKAIADFQETARRAGVPAGWLR